MNQDLVKTEVMFKVTYKEVVTKETYIDKLGDCDRFSSIVKVESVMIKNYGRVSNEQIKAAIGLKRREQEIESKIYELEKIKQKKIRLKKELRELG